MKSFSEMLKKTPLKPKEECEDINTDKEQTEQIQSENKDHPENRDNISDETAVFAEDDVISENKTALKAAFVSIAMILAVLSSMGAEAARTKYLERYHGSLSDITDMSNVLYAWNQTAADTRKLMEEGGWEEPAIYDPNAEVKLKVPFYSQKDYPTGCELVSTSMLLAKYGIKLTAEEIVTKGYIKTKKVYLDPHGDPYGPDPNMTFIGDPLADNGFGCYSGAIVKALKKIVPDDRYEVVDLTGESLSDICYYYVDRGIPVLYWGSLQMEPFYYDVVNHWYIDEGKRKGEEFRWTSNEHCMVLIGHNKNNYIFNDPSVDKAGAEYPRPIVDKRFKSLGQQAVAIVPVEKKK